MSRPGNGARTSPTSRRSKLMPPWPASTVLRRPVPRPARSGRRRSRQAQARGSTPDAPKATRRTPRLAREFASDWPLGPPDVILTMDQAYPLDFRRLRRVPRLRPQDRLPGRPLDQGRRLQAGQPQGGPPHHRRDRRLGDGPPDRRPGRQARLRGGRRLRRRRAAPRDSCRSGPPAADLATSPKGRDTSSPRRPTS